MIAKILNIILLLFVPFLMVGIIRKTKAFWGGRKGPSVLQPLYDFIKLIKKSLVISKTTLPLTSKYLSFGNDNP